MLRAVDAIRVSYTFSGRYRDPGLLLAQRIGAESPTTSYSGVGGNVPQTLVNQACLDIRHGRTGVVLVAGAGATVAGAASSVSMRSSCRTSAIR